MLSKVIKYCATKYYDIINYINGEMPKPILLIKQDGYGRNQTNIISFNNSLGVEYKSILADITTLTNATLDIEELKNSKLEYIELERNNQVIQNYKTLQIILDNLPETLIHLIVWYKHYFINTSSCSNITYNKLPIGLKTLEIYNREFSNSLDNLPPNLETLKLSCTKLFTSLDYLPCSLKTLHINSMDFNSSLDNLPPKLEELFLEITIKNQLYEHNNLLNNLPNNIKHLTLFISSKNPTDLVINKLPDNLEYLRVNNSYGLVNQSVKFHITTLPPNLDTFIIVNNCVSNFGELEIAYPDIAFEYFECGKL